jgi:hypothetical protein
MWRCLGCGLLHFRAFTRADRVTSARAARPAALQARSADGRRTRRVRCVPSADRSCRTVGLRRDLRLTTGNLFRFCRVHARASPAARDLALLLRHRVMTRIVSDERTAADLALRAVGIRTAPTGCWRCGDRAFRGRWCRCALGARGTASNHRNHCTKHPLIHHRSVRHRLSAEQPLLRSWKATASDRVRGSGNTTVASRPVPTLS